VTARERARQQERLDRLLKLVANLPYNVAAPVVLRALDEAPEVVDILVMVQREVGERLAEIGRASCRERV